MDRVKSLVNSLHQGEPRAIARAISLVEEDGIGADALIAALDRERIAAATVVGITGPPGAGKSTLTSRLITLYRQQGRRLGIIAVDPSSPISGGALLGDRIRMMRHALDPGVVVRSMASRGRLGGLCAAAGAALRIMAAAGCQAIIIETVGVGQSEMDIIRLADITLLVLAPGLGDDIQAMKAGLLEVADLLVVNKADRSGADALAMDLETMLQERGEEPAVCLTVAATGQGVEELAARITARDKLLRRSGEQSRRRRRAHDLEVLDWALELLRPRLLARIKAGNQKNVAVNPRRRAREILNNIDGTTGG